MGRRTDRPSGNSLTDRYKSTTNSGPTDRFLPASDHMQLDVMAARRARLARRRAARAQDKSRSVR